MSRSNYCGYPREKTVKFFHKRTGWYGESCFAQEGRAWIKRTMRRINRHVQNHLLKQALFKDKEY